MISNGVLPRPQRHWGQHFLNDSTVLEAMMRAAGIRPGEIILEIGPGPGVLTRALLEEGATVVAIERDRRFEAPLQAIARSGRFRLVIDDAIRLDWSGLGLMDRQFRLIANIPYSITTPLLEKIVSIPRPSQAILMIQEDVARRLMASPGASERGALSVIIQETLEIRLIRRVSRASFAPPPKVDSAIIQCTLRPYEAAEGFAKFLHQCFRHRRKILLSGLKALDRSVDWNRIFDGSGISLKARPQEVTNEQWRQLYESVQR